MGVSGESPRRRRNTLLSVVPPRRSNATSGPPDRPSGERMMQAKPAAVLTSGLLARKGEACDQPSSFCDRAAGAGGEIKPELSAPRDGALGASRRVAVPRSSRCASMAIVIAGCASPRFISGDLASRFWLKRSMPISSARPSRSAAVKCACLRRTRK